MDATLPPLARLLPLLAWMLLACGDDASAPSSDAGTPRDATAFDLSQPGEDATTPASDAATPERDATMPTLDAATPREDAATPDGEIAPPPPPPDDGGVVPPPAPGTWGLRAELVLPRSEVAVAELDGLIYVIGGYPADRVAVTTVQVYDPARDAWELTTPLPMPLDHSVAVGVGGRVFVIGGQRTGHSGGFTDEVLAYDPAVREWVARARMPTARGAGAGAVIDDRIYVAGGRPPRGADFAVYDVSDDAWAPLPDVPTARNHLAAAAIDGRVYVVGGRPEAGFTSEVYDVVEIFDPATGAWSEGPRLPRPRGGINSIVAFGCLHVFGGEGNPIGPEGVFADHDVLDPRTGVWTSLAPMPIPVHGVTGAAFIDGLIYLPAGGTREGGSSGTDLLQVYRPDRSCP